MDKEVKGWVIIASTIVVMGAILVFGLTFGLAYFKSIGIPVTKAEVQACETLPLDTRVLCLNHLESGT